MDEKTERKGGIHKEGGVIPSLETWKRRVLIERDLTDFVAHDL